MCVSPGRFASRNTETAPALAPRARLRQITAMRLSRLFLGHIRLFIAIAAGAAAWFLLPESLSPRTRTIGAWDAGAALYLLLIAILFGTAPAQAMPARAEAQQEGEWTLFWLVVAGITVSFAAIVSEFSTMKSAAHGQLGLKLGLVVATLLLSWLLTHAVFALRYAHEFYETSPDGRSLAGGLEFPSEPCPDYWDFLYFALVLGMTFQVSDVQITSRKLRRLATLHGFLGFTFNTVIVALTVNLASGLLG